MFSANSKHLVVDVIDIYDIRYISLLYRILCKIYNNNIVHN